MILFEEDWEVYTTAIVDYSTPNKSFLKYAQLLRAMGIDNWKWPLALIHPELRGLDPYDPELTRDQQKLFGLEFKINPWAYFRLAARAPGSTIETPIYFEANRSNMALYWLYFNHITVCLLQPRQTGKSYAAVALQTFINNIASQGARSLLLTKDDTLRAKTLTDLKVLTDLLPTFLKLHSKTDIANREEYNVSFLDNNIKGLVARNDPIAADKIGRGHTVENTITDEAAYLFYIEIAMRIMLAATTAARKTAEIRGNPYGNIFLTTAGKKDDRDGAVMYNFFHDSAPWTEHFMKCKNIEELRSAIKGSSREGKILRVHCVFNHRQLGYTDEWLRETAAENNSYGEQFERDYLNIWTSGSQLSPMTLEDRKRIRACERELKYAEISIHGQIVTRWYQSDDDIERIMRQEYVVMSVDTSDAMGKDDIAVNYRHLKTGEVLGCASINEINLITVANYFVSILRKYENITMIIERRNQAATIIDYMHKQMIALKMDPFKRMYNLCVQEHMEYSDRYSEIQKPHNALNEQFLAQHKKFFGFITSGTGITSRSELYSTTLRAAVKYTGDTIYDKQTIDQILSLIIKNGRVDHPAGGHDDLCVAWLLSYFFMANGRNLQHYGIPMNYVLSHNAVLHSATNKEEMYQLQRSRAAKEFTDRILERIKTERDHNVVEHLMMEIENVKADLGPQHEISISVDSMLNELRNKKTIMSQGKRSLFASSY